MAHLYPSYMPFGDDMNFHHHQQSKGLINNNNNNNYYNGKLGSLDESDNMNHAEDQKWNMAAARLAMSANMRANFDNKSNDNNNASHASVNGGGRVMGSSLNNSDNNKSSKNMSSNSSNRPNSSGGKNKHKANSSPNNNSAQNEIVNSMINKILNMDMKQHNHHQALDSYVPSSQKGILSHETIGSKPSGNMMTSQSSQQGNSNSQRANPNSPNNSTPVVDKRFKTLPASESLPRNETLGGYIFVCNNDTMQEDLKRQLFGLPQRYRDSVRTIQPGLPLFLYNYTTHQLHGIFEAASFGGSNIDPTAWEDKKNKGESRFPAQVRIRVRRMCKPLEEDAFRPVLFHYDGPKFRLQLSVPETLAIMDLLSQNGSV